MELYRNPANLFVAGYLASPPMNLLTLQMGRDEAGGLVAEAEGIRIEWPEPQRSAYAAYRDRKVVVGFRPEDLWIEPYAPAASPVDTMVVAVEMLGPEVILVASLPGMRAPEIWARLPPDYTGPPGTRQRLWLDPARTRLFDVNTGAAVASPA
jgi:ABC-type sugar transport system ATPase subunit